jgi:hypothetical protein
MANLYKHITAAAPTTTVCCAVPCDLAGISINKATANGVITIYNDKATAGSDVVAVITSPGTLIQSQASIDFKDIHLNKGLVIVTSTAAQDITVSYKPTA